MDYTLLTFFLKSLEKIRRSRLNVKITKLFKLDEVFNEECVYYFNVRRIFYLQF